MKIDLQTTKFYFLTCNNEKRKNHMLEEFQNYNITEVNPITNIEKTKSGISGFSRILDLALKNQDPTKPFQPFIIFEDDVKKYREFPNEIEIPDNADILYLGLSSFGMSENSHTPHVFYENIDENTIRIYNMLSLHGTAICSMRGLLAIQKCMMESYFTNNIWDMYTAWIQPFYNVYALRKPLVYQWSELGGQEGATKIEFNEPSNPNIPDYWINKNLASILTCNPDCNAAYPPSR